MYDTLQEEGVEKVKKNRKSEKEEEQWCERGIQGQGKAEGNGQCGLNRYMNMRLRTRRE